jgi:hypothetical protein
MPQVRDESTTLSSVMGADNMQRFEVLQLQEDRWSVMYQGRTLYSYITEEEAREAALALATIACSSGQQASLVVSPAEQIIKSYPRNRSLHFTGM